MPAVFSATYTPIAAAGTQGQIKHVARLLATQLNSVGLGPGASIAKTQSKVPVVSSYRVNVLFNESSPVAVSNRCLYEYLWLTLALISENRSRR